MALRDRYEFWSMVCLAIPMGVEVRLEVISVVESTVHTISPFSRCLSLSLATKHTGTCAGIGPDQKMGTDP